MLVQARNISILFLVDLNVNIISNFICFFVKEMNDLKVREERKMKTNESHFVEYNKLSA